jgi:hypothetical protein
LLRCLVFNVSYVCVIFVVIVAVLGQGSVARGRC